MFCSVYKNQFFCSVLHLKQLVYFTLNFQFLYMQYNIGINNKFQKKVIGHICVYF